MGRYAAAAGWYGRANKAQALGRARPKEQARAAFNYGLALKRLGRWDRAVPELEQACQFYEQSGDLEQAADGRLVLGHIFLDARGYATALRHYEASYAGYRHPSSRPRAELGIAMARIGLGRFSGLEEQLTALYRDGQCDVRGYAGYALAAMLRQQGRVAEALALSDEVLTLSSADLVLLAANANERLVCQLLRGDCAAAGETLATLAPMLEACEAPNGALWWCAALFLRWERG